MWWRRQWPGLGPCVSLCGTMLAAVVLAAGASCWDCCGGQNQCTRCELTPKQITQTVHSTVFESQLLAHMTLVMTLVKTERKLASHLVEPAQARSSCGPAAHPTNHNAFFDCSLCAAGCHADDRDGRPASPCRGAQAGAAWASISAHKHRAQAGGCMGQSEWAERSDDVGNARVARTLPACAKTGARSCTGAAPLPLPREPPATRHTFGRARELRGCGTACVKRRGFRRSL